MKIIKQLRFKSKINNKYEQPKPVKITVFKRMFYNLNNHWLIITKCQSIFKNN